MATPMTSIVVNGDPEEVMSCPYNKAHQIIRKRMQFHLVKCKRNYPEVNMQECIYNTVHKVPEPEWKFHLETCSDRQKIDKFYYRKENSMDSHDKFPVPEVAVNLEECWDSVNVGAYDPSKKCETAPILRQLNVEPAAKRRDFRFAERQRLQSLDYVTKDVVQSNEREMAADFAEHYGACAGANNQVIVEENDPIELTSLMDRIRLGSLPVRPLPERIKTQLEETESDASISDAERWSSVRPRKGCGRGKFLKTTTDDE